MVWSTSYIQHTWHRQVTAWRRVCERVCPSCWPGGPADHPRHCCCSRRCCCCCCWPPSCCCCWSGSCYFNWQTFRGHVSSVRDIGGCLQWLKCWWWPLPDQEQCCYCFFSIFYWYKIRYLKSNQIDKRTSQLCQCVHWRADNQFLQKICSGFRAHSGRLNKTHTFWIWRVSRSSGEMNILNIK